MNSKDNILKFLEENRGSWISGEEMASRLYLSRNAVWKAVRCLRNEGYSIKSVTNKGYLLEEDSDILSLQGISPYLDPQIDRSLITVHDCVGSTNEEAKKLACSGASHGTVVIADRQTEGRGHYKRSFYSPSGGIYLSFVMRPEHFPYTDPKTVTAYAADKVIRTIRKVSGKNADVKPVNDIYIDGRKVCGILTECMTDIESGEVQWTVIGIGLNYMLNPDDLPEEIKERAGAVFNPGDERVPRNQVTGVLINQVLSGLPGEI